MLSIVGCMLNCNLYRRKESSSHVVRGIRINGV